MEFCKFCHTSPGPGEKICQTWEESLHGVGCVWMEIAKREDAEREAAVSQQHNEEFDRWEAMSDAEREREIRAELRR